MKKGKNFYSGILNKPIIRNGNCESQYHARYKALCEFYNVDSGVPSSLSTKRCLATKLLEAHFPDFPALAKSVSHMTDQEVSDLLNRLIAEVPGFKTVNRGGRKPSWKTSDKVILFSRIISLMRENKSWSSEKAAAVLLSRLLQLGRSKMPLPAYANYSSARSLDRKFRTIEQEVRECERRRLADVQEKMEMLKQRFPAEFEQFILLISDEESSVSRKRLDELLDSNSNFAQAADQVFTPSENAWLRLGKWLDSAILILIKSD